LIQSIHIHFVIPLIISVLAIIPGIAFSMPDTLVVVGEISFEGNKTTRDHIIARELLFTSGDTLEQKEFQDKLEQSRKNLLNTSLFNFVTSELEYRPDKPQEVDVTFHFTERWYIWPWPVVEFADRNFNTWWEENRSLSRMSYGVILKWGNFRGRREQIDITAKFGYNNSYGIDYTIPYLNRKKKLGLGIGAAYGRTHEVPVVNMDDKLVYYKDEEKHIMHEVKSYVSLIYRNRIHNTHTFRLEYDLMDFDDTLIFINPSFTPDGSSRLQYLSMVYQYKSDHRDDRPYPLNGYYFDVELAKRGFGVLDNGGLDVFYVHSTFRRFWEFSRRWFFASGLNAKFSSENRQPFFMDRAIGWGRDIVRGYEYYVVNGQNFGIWKNNIKFALLPRKEFDIGFIRSEKISKTYFAIYLNAFLDMGFADNIYRDGSQNNELENSLLVGYGAGLDFVTYYDLVLRVEYAINRMNEHGIFLHFMAPI
jgi:outer membrane protein assembly factor BamA